MARTVGQIVGRGRRTWLLRVYNGHDPETKKRKYLTQTIHGGLRDAQAYLNKMLGERDLGRNLDSSRLKLNQLIEVCAKSRLRAKSLRDYEGLMRRYVRPTLKPNCWRRFPHSTSRRSTGNYWTETYRATPHGCGWSEPR
jgi:hypothetical protein